MALRELQQAWEDLGNLDPYWGMTGGGRRKFGRWNPDELLATGDARVADMMATAERLGYPVGREAVLDFGCGVGRLTRAFRSHFRQYYGVDIAESMIARARHLNASLTDCTFIASADNGLSILPDRHFDLVFSWGVLQHVPEKEAVKSYLSALMRVLKEDGLLAVQAFTYIRPLYRLQPRRRLYAALRRLWVAERVLYETLRLYPQQAHFVSRSEIARFISSAGGQILAVDVESPAGAPHQSHMYYATRATGARWQSERGRPAGNALIGAGQGDGDGQR
jgi:ubiquinone/menaquinone biosynthesis C-methylase UbiE